MTRSPAAAAERPEWALYRRWCAATGTPPIPADEATIDAFLAQLPARGSVRRARLAAIYAAHDDAGIPIRTARIRPVVPGVAHVGQVLRSQRGNVRGWRDRAIVAVIAAGVPRASAAALLPDDLRTGSGWQVLGHAVDRVEDAAECPRCALAGWVALLPDVIVGFRTNAAADAMRLQVRTVAGEHVCDDPERDGWRYAPALLLPLDQHGWAGSAPLTRRSVAAVVAAGPLEPEPEPTPTPTRAPFGYVDRDGLADQFDDVDADVDALADRAATLLAELQQIASVIDTARKPRP